MFLLHNSWLIHRSPMKLTVLQVFFCFMFLRSCQNIVYFFSFQFKNFFALFARIRFNFVSALSNWKTCAKSKKKLKCKYFNIYVYSILLYTSLGFFSPVNKFCESVSYFNTCLCCLLSGCLCIIAAVVVVVHIDDCRSPMPNRTHFPKQEA